MKGAIRPFFFLPIIELETFIAAPIERCFDLARDVDLHVRSAADTGEVAVGGVTSGRIGFGESVTWRARHFGIKQTLTVRITSLTWPTHFCDTQVRGVFRRFDHDHFFEQNEDGTTLMRDRFDYESPFGWLGNVVDWLFLERYMRSFLLKRNQIVKAAAEVGGSSEIL